MFFNAMATDEEKAQLRRCKGNLGRQAERGVRWKIVQKISETVAAWFAQISTAQGKQVPKLLKPNSPKVNILEVNTLLNYTTLGKIDPNSTAFATLRASFESPGSRTRKRSPPGPSSPTSSTPHSPRQRLVSAERS